MKTNGIVRINKIFIILALSAVIIISTYFETFWMSFLQYGDFYAHSESALQYMNGELKCDYPVYYITFAGVRKLLAHFVNSSVLNNYSAAVANTFYSVLCEAAFLFINYKVFNVSNTLYNALLTLAMMFTGPLRLPFVEFYYIGVGSFNTWHSPTQNTVRFLTILIFYLFIFYYERDVDKALSRRQQIVFYSGMAGLLLFSLLCKPSFMQVFAPTAAVIVLIDLIKKRIDFRKALIYAAVFLPSALLIAKQTLFYFGESSGRDSGIGISLFYVWSRSAGFVPVNICNAVAFPLFVLIFCTGKNNGNKRSPLIYSFIFYLLSVAEYSLLVEKGSQITAGNFSWGMCLAIGIIMFSATHQFIDYIRNNIPAIKQRDPKALFITISGSLAFCYHLFSGVLYFFQLYIRGRQCF